MRSLLVLLLAAVAVLADSGRGRDHYDLAILGAGPQGLSLAQMYIRKFPSRTVAVIEPRSVVGGNANTEPNPNVPPGVPPTIEIGAQGFENTVVENAFLGAGTYQVDSVEFANSVLPGTTYFPSPAAPSPTYLYSFARSAAVDVAPYGLQVSTPEGNAAFTQAFQNLVGLLLKYPFLNNLQTVPNPIPDELKQPFIQTFNQYGLQPLITVFASAMVGVSDFTNTSTLTALMEFPPALLPFFIPTFQQAYFVLTPNTQTFYEKIQGNIQANPRNLFLLNTTAIYVERERDNNGKKRDCGVELVLKTIGADGKAKYRDIEADKLAVTFPATLQSAGFLDLDFKERAALNGLSVSSIWAFSADIRGPITVDATTGQPIGFSIYNLDFTRPQFQFLPQRPYVKAVSRAVPWGYASGVFAADGPLSMDQARALINQQLSNLPASQVTFAQVVSLEPHSNYHPRLEGSAMNINADQFQLFANLNGYRDTYWLGTTATKSPGTVLAWDLSNRTVSAMQ